MRPMIRRHHAGGGQSPEVDALNQVQTGTTGTQGDKIDRTLWDEEVLAAANLVVRLFQVPNGQGGKVLDNTNNTQAGQMPSNRKLLVHAIKVMWVSETTGGIKATAADVQAFFTQLARTVATFYINNREFGQWTLQELFGPAMLIAVNPAVTLNLPFPEPRFHGIFPLNRPILLAGLTSFYFEITHSVAPTVATVGDRFRLGLSGIETRIN